MNLRPAQFGTATTIVLAGLAGGFAEMLWVTIYGALSPVSAAAMAREVTASVFPGAASAPGGLALGIGIHLTLSIALAFAFFALLRNFLHGDTGIIVIAVGALVALWAFNFLVLLPVVNPRFPTLMPSAVTLLSKALFGAAMGTTLAKLRL